MRKLIRETIESIELLKNFLEDFIFLSDFDLTSSKKNEELEEYTFVNDIEKNKTIIKIIKNNNGWSLDYNIVGYLRDQEGDYFIGPIKDYDEFKKLCNDKINNNLLLTTKNSDDGKDKANEKFVIELINQMIERKEEIYSLPKGRLEDLKKLCKIIEKALNKKTIEEIIPSLYSKNKNLTGVQNILNKTQDIDFNKNINWF